MMNNSTFCPICHRRITYQPSPENSWIQLFVPHVNGRTNRSCAGSETLALYSQAKATDARPV